MYKGGIADKLGNRYEAKWLVYKLLSVLAGDYDAVFFEGIDTSFTGFEFSLQRGETTEWHQTKVNAPNGNWTIRALERENLLAAFKRKLQAKAGNECHFVSQDNAKTLRELANDARIASNAEEFLSTISNENTEEFEKLKTAWKCEDSDVWQNLCRIYVTVQPETGLTTSIKILARLLLATDRDVFPFLRDYMEQKFNKEVTREVIKSWLLTQANIQFKAWLNPVSIRESIAAATDRYLSTHTPFGLGGETLPRRQSEAISNEILSNEGADVFILSGVAGSGKSGAIREIINSLRANNIPVLSFRVDQFLDKHTTIEIGSSLLHRNESPVSTLKGIAPKSTSVLIIDQLDAVSEVSGRDGIVKSAILELIEEAQEYGGLKIIIACRTYDLENDSRFRSLSKDLKTQKIQLPHLDWTNEISPLLVKLKFEPEKIAERQRQLLTIPINLAVFIEIGDKNFSFNSRTDLFSKLIEKKQRTLSKQNFDWAIIRPLEAAAMWMSERQILTAPNSVMDEFGGAVDWLASEGLIIVSDRTLNFFHESLFDYVYARSFIKGSQSTLDLLLSTEQHLFRRTQIRQIFTMMREEDPTKYLEQLQALLTSDKIRTHLKLSVAQWLSSIPIPTIEELKLIREIYSEGSLTLNERTVLLQNSNWFELLNSQGIPLKWLESADQMRRRIVRNWLSNIAGQYPSEIAHIMRSWWANDPEKAEILIDWFGFLRRNKPDDDLLRLCEDVIKSKPMNLFRDDGRDRTMMLLHSWVDHDPEKCGRMVALLFEAWFEMHPDANLLSRDDYKLLDNHSLQELAKKSQLAFVEGTTQAILKTVEQTVTEGENGANWYSLNTRFRSNYLHGFDGLMQLFEKSLIELTVDHPEFVHSTLDVLKSNIHRRFLGIHLSVIWTNPKEFGLGLLDLLEDPDLLKAGNDGAEFRLFAKAAKAVMEEHSDTKKTIETYVLGNNYEIERAKRLLEWIKNGEANEYVTKESVLRFLRYSGCKKWNVLRVIGEYNLSDLGKKQFTELSRKFGPENIEKENNTEVRYIGSPIGGDNCEKMADSHWIKAMLKYNSDEGRNWSSGGARELASNLANKVKDNPDRFSKLLMKIPVTYNHRYFGEILRGIKDSDNPNFDFVIDALKHVHSHFKDTLSEEILSIVETHTELILEKGVKDIVFDYVENGEAPENSDFDSEGNHSDKEILSVEDLVRSGSGMVVSSVYGGRAKAWETIGSCLWKHKSILEEVWCLVEKQASNESSVKVRLSIFEASTPLFNEDKTRYEDAIRTLIDPTTLEDNTVDPITIFATRRAINMHKHIDFHCPELAAQLINQMIDQTYWMVVGILREVST